VTIGAPIAPVPTTMPATASTAVRTPTLEERVADLSVYAESGDPVAEGEIWYVEESAPIFGEDGIGFDDLLDVINPLHHIPVVGTIYRRTRSESDGVKRQRAEVRFDEIAGCLHTPAGGSSRQTIMVVEGESVRSRLLSPREAASLMGLPDTYVLPQNYNDAYKLAGDGVAAPVVRFIAGSIFEPTLKRNRLALVA